MLKYENQSKKIALVTGSSGYIGSQLVQHLLRDNWCVHLITRNSVEIEDSTYIKNKYFHIYDGKWKSLDRAVTLSRPDVVFHLASLVIVEHQSNQIDSLINSNVLFGTQLLESCARNGVKHFINTGTSWQHYRENLYDPVCLYAATKQAFEDILDYYVDAYQMQVITLKLFDTYGPHDPRSKLVNLLLRSLQSGEKIEMSPGEQLLDLVHIDDVIRAYLLCAKELEESKEKYSHTRYAVSSGHAISVRSLVDLIEKLCQKKINAVFGGRPYRQREVMFPWRGGNRPREWIPQVSLTDGLISVIESSQES